MSDTCAVTFALAVASGPLRSLTGVSDTTEPTGAGILNADRKQLRGVKFADHSAEKVRTICAGLGDLCARWADAIGRVAIIEQLANCGTDSHTLVAQADKPDVAPPRPPLSLSIQRPRTHAAARPRAPEKGTGKDLDRALQTEHRRSRESLKLAHTARRSPPRPSSKKASPASERLSVDYPADGPRMLVKTPRSSNLVQQQ